MHRTRGAPQAVSGNWVYISLDWAKPISLAWYVVLPFLVAASWGIMIALAALREMLHRRLCHRGPTPRHCCDDPLHVGAPEAGAPAGKLGAEAMA